LHKAEVYNNWLFCALHLGPDFWGLVNPEWILCSKGKRQSPISIDATKLMFDPYLAQLHIDPNKVRSVPVYTCAKT